MTGELVEVVDEVPRDVQRDRRREPGDGVHLRRVLDLLVGCRAARPAAANTLKRVPELPNAHDGSSIACRSRSGAMSAKVFMPAPVC